MTSAGADLRLLRTSLRSASAMLAGVNLRQRNSMRLIIWTALAAGSVLVSVPSAFAQTKSSAANTS